jgi:hypothetical protein
LAGLLGRGVMAEDGLALGGSIAGGELGVGHGVDDFVNENIRTLGELDEIVGGTGIAGQGDGMPGIVNAVSIRRFNLAMVNQKSCHLHS